MNKQKLKTNKTKKRISTIIAILAILALLLTGTYAWVDYSQHRTNEFDNTNSKTYDIYLVEDFEPVHNWTTSDAPKLKNISVINKGEAPEFGAGYVRLSLKEYFEFSEKTYTYSTNWYALDNSGDYVWIDPNVYTTEAAAEAAAEALGYYNGVGYETDYTSGVEGWFAIAGADHINGQYGKHMITGIENSTPDSLAPGVERAEYEETENHKLSPTGECAYTPHDWTGADQFGFRDYVKWNLGENVISLTEWAKKTETEKDDFSGWIYDDRTTSGYVYWSQPLAPETDTTKLLETVELINQPSGDFYYALHVDMETLSLDELAKEVYEWQDAPSMVIEYWLKRQRPSVPETTEAPEIGERNIFRFVINTNFYDYDSTGAFASHTDYPMTDSSGNVLPICSQSTFFGADSKSIVINIGTHPDNNYDVYWGDGSSSLGFTGGIDFDDYNTLGGGSLSDLVSVSDIPRHTYESEGTYTITIVGDIPGGINFGYQAFESIAGEYRLIEVCDPLPYQETNPLERYYVAEGVAVGIEDFMFFGTFTCAFNLTAISENIFENNSHAKNFVFTFNLCGISSIPENLFVNNNVEVLLGTFVYCNNIFVNLPEWWIDTHEKFPNLIMQQGTFACLNAPNYIEARTAGWGSQ